MNVNKRLLIYALQFWRPLAVAIVMLVIAVSADLTGPLIAKTIINRDIVGVIQALPVPAKSLSRHDLFHYYQPVIPNLLMLLLLYFGLILISALFTYGQKLLMQVSANRILQRMRRDVFHQISRLPIQYFDNLPAGKIVSRITNDTEAIRDFYVSVVANFLSSAVTMVGIYIAMALLDVRFALFSGLLLPVIGLWIVLYRKYAVPLNHRIRTLLSEINANINEILQGMTVIRAFHRQERTCREFDELNTQFFTSQIRLLKMNAASGWNLVGVLRGIFFVAMITYFSYQSFHLKGAIQFGVLYAFIDYVNRLFQPINQVINQLANLEQARVSAERVFQLLDEAGDDVIAGGVPRYHGNVRFEDVYFSYDGRTNVLKGISFSARQGQTVALVGHTGSGKSSIINLLFRFYDPQSGKITIDGMDIANLPRQHLRQHMGIVLQDPFLFTGTIASNVSLGDPRIPRAKIEQALRDVGAEPLLEQLPEGWETPVLEKGSTLSAGQRQLISFARALSFDPAILILDEATANIDTETETLIQQALQVLKRGRTTLVIAHRLSTIRNADLILVLERGTIVEQGTHDELLVLGGRYTQMYQLQFDGSAV